MDKINDRTITGKMKTSPLDGVWVHVFNKKITELNMTNSEDMEHQGQVLGVFQDKHIVVQLCSFLDGRPTIVRLFPIEYATNGQMIFYHDGEEMANSYERCVNIEQRKEIK